MNEKDCIGLRAADTNFCLGGCIADFAAEEISYASDDEPEELTD